VIDDVEPSVCTVAAADQNAAAVADDEAVVYEDDTPDQDLAIQVADGLVHVISLLLHVLFCITLSPCMSGV
jgi:hypothetical protein